MNESLQSEARHSAARTPGGVPPALAQGAAAAPPPALPWWRVGMVWLVVGGPLTVVVAAIFTAVLAINGADPVIGGESAARGTATERASMSPAVQARNHAAKPTP